MFVGPFTGAESLRTPHNRYIFHVRASYFDETEAIVQHLTAMSVNKIAVFYQNDGYGQAGLRGLEEEIASLQAAGYDVTVGDKVSYERGTTNLDGKLSTASLLSIQSDIAEQVASAIGQPYGAVFNLTAEDIATRPLASLRSFECVVRFRQRWREYDQRDYGDMRACLEQTIATDPYYARAYASLALLDLDTVRFGFGKDRIKADPLQEASRN